MSIRVLVAVLLLQLILIASYSFAHAGCCFGGSSTYEASGGWQSMKCGDSTCRVNMPAGCTVTEYYYYECAHGSVINMVYFQLHLDDPDCVLITTLNCQCNCQQETHMGQDYQVCYSDCEFD